MRVEDIPFKHVARIAPWRGQHVTDLLMDELKDFAEEVVEKRGKHEAFIIFETVRNGKTFENIELLEDVKFPEKYLLTGLALVAEDEIIFAAQNEFLFIIGYEKMSENPELAEELAKKHGLELENVFEPEEKYQFEREIKQSAEEISPTSIAVFAYKQPFSERTGQHFLELIKKFEENVMRKYFL